MGGGMKKSALESTRELKMKIENGKRKTSSFLCGRKKNCNYFLIEPKNYRSAHEGTTTPPSVDQADPATKQLHKN